MDDFSFIQNSFWLAKHILQMKVSLQSSSCLQHIFYGKSEAASQPSLLLEGLPPNSDICIRKLQIRMLETFFIQ